MSNKFKEIVLQVHTFQSQRNLMERLDDFLYEKVENIILPGEFAVKGDSMYIYSTSLSMPIRIDFFGDEIEKISTIDLESKKIKDHYDTVILKSNILVLDDTAKIRPGDYIVHEDYGVGLYKGRGIKIVEGEEIEYIYLTYLNEQILYLPVELKWKLSAYVGIGGRKPKLSRLGSESWKKTYKKTYENVLIMARELLQVYAKREIVEKKPIKINTEWKKEIEKSFAYKETDDQLAAIADVYSDLESKKPLDRLICGDVGFGKTEVALRTAAQFVATGMQVAVLVPTTILAEQHYSTIKERFSHLPVNVARISRFSSTKEQQEIAAEVAAGKIDILVGTHKLFGSSLVYKNLGLLIIDEEQKFGVKQKEKLKKLKDSLNVLSLTATPIPRTLFMALSGIRDISSITNPPAGRKEIETEVFKYDEERIYAAIEKEISRGGQVYFLHNKVQSILGISNYLKKLFPKLTIKIAHGQMPERELAKRMGEFTERKIDILVCSTIIENGLDLPNVNTLIVEDADKFGLSQLYQIRGRIGRSSRQSYAYFTYPEKQITANAFKRLKALAENTELGSGYNISLSDLEIRGGGNILGREQHGNMEAVGLVLYTKLLNQAVSRLKNNEW